MKNTLSIALGASLLLFSFTVPGDQIRFGVKEKTKLSKVFEDKGSFHSVGMSVTVDGNDVGGEMPDMKLTFEESSKFEVTDEYVGIKSGKPTKLKRTFDKLSGKFSQNAEMPDDGEGHGGKKEENKDRASELEGKTVVFTLGEGDEYKAEFEDGKGDAKLLEHLSVDMDLRGLLPEDEVAEGKSWEISAKAFHDAVGNPGGDLKLKAEGDDEDSDFDEQFSDNIKGKAKGTFKGTREVDGHKCAVIALEAELKTEAKKDKSGEGGHNGVMTLELEFSIEGELVWDTEEGHFRSCEVTNKIKLAMKNSMSMEFNGEKHEMEQVTEFEGEGEFKATIGG